MRHYSIERKYNTYLIITVTRGRSWRSGTKCDRKIDWLWDWSPLEEIKYLLKFIFPFLRSGVEVKRGVEFCHSTRNASRIRQKVGTECLSTRFPLPTLLCAGYSVMLIWFLIWYYRILYWTLNNIDFWSNYFFRNRCSLYWSQCSSVKSKWGKWLNSKYK